MCTYHQSLPWGCRMRQNIEPKSPSDGEILCPNLSGNLLKGRWNGEQLTRAHMMREVTNPMALMNDAGFYSNKSRELYFKDRGIKQWVQDA